jgi:hypothetical protein
MASEDAAVPSMHWLVPQLDLQTQLRLELDRRTAAKLSRDELSVLVDKLIVDWYHRSALLDNLLGRIRSMEVEMALLMAKPSPAAPTEEHYEWAADLLRDLGR